MAEHSYTSEGGASASDADRLVIQGERTVKPGQWVMAVDHIAIFMGTFDQEHAIVDFVDPGSGETLERSAIIPAELLAHPYAAQLPRSRVAHLSAEELRALGYE